jgi:pyruvate,water dikinase
MAVLVQPLQRGKASGITFSRHPLKETQVAVEAVYGLNSGLVDGAIEPDRWFVERDKLERIEHIPPNTARTRLIYSPGIGLTTENLAGGEAKLPPLGTDQVKSIAKLALTLEKKFHTAQDIEWTLSGQTFWLLQSRPVTATRAGPDGDKRSWYLSLHRSYDNLIELWDEIENRLLPDMDRDSDQLAAIDLTELSNTACAHELQRRLERNSHWTGIYWSTFIPFAHGVRLFGEIYNDTMLPDDPFEFVSLLAGESMLGVRRNKLLAECAQIISNNKFIKDQLRSGDLSKIEDKGLLQNLELLEKQYGLPPVGDGSSGNISDSPLLALLGQYADIPAGPGQAATQKHRLEQRFIEKAKNVKNLDPSMLLALARASYRLRDDDNIHIGRIAAQLERAAQHTRERLSKQGRSIGHGSIEELIRALQGEALPAVTGPTDLKPAETAKNSIRLQARQLIGQPASEGLARGNARVVENGTELDSFKAGEILVCDAIDPTMTFFAPLAAAIVERRGGMLIHGAIIAREYGIPCVTGITDATRYIQTGDHITVDGYLGIVIRESSRD